MTPDEARTRAKNLRRALLALRVVQCARVVVQRSRTPVLVAVDRPGGEQLADAFIDALVELEHALDALDHPDEGG